MKRMIALSLTVLMVVAVLAGCAPANSGTSSSSEPAVTKAPGIVKILGSDPALKTAPENMAVWQKVESDVNVKLQWELIPVTQYEAVVSTRLASGSIDADIFNPVQ